MRKVIDLEKQLTEYNKQIEDCTAKFNEAEKVKNWTVSIDLETILDELNVLAFTTERELNETKYMIAFNKNNSK